MCYNLVKTTGGDEMKEIPKTLDQFLEQGWTNYIRYKVNKFNLKDINNDTEDLVQEIILQMIRYNYIEKY